MRNTFVLAALLIAVGFLAQPAALKAQNTQQKPNRSETGHQSPKGSVRGTIDHAIRALEAYDCETFAVAFLNPLKRAAIADLEAYKRQRRCSPGDKGNIADVLLTLRLARLATPEYKGVTAVINLEGIGAPIASIILMRYIDGKWYFNEL